jgi:hypothetical protein
VVFEVFDVTYIFAMLNTSDRPFFAICEFWRELTNPHCSLLSATLVDYFGVVV